MHLERDEEAKALGWDSATQAAAVVAERLLRNPLNESLNFVWVNIHADEKGALPSDKWVQIKITPDMEKPENNALLIVLQQKKSGFDPVFAYTTRNDPKQENCIIQQHILRYFPCI